MHKINVNFNDTTGETDAVNMALKAGSEAITRGLHAAEVEALFMVIVVEKNGPAENPPRIRIASNIAADRAMDFLELIVNTTRSA
jgi:hypothetical protein